jgi:hypothetical protein
VTEDRFEDLGAERRAEIGDQLAERDRTHPEVRRPEVPRPGNKYAWAVGIVAIMGLSVLLFAETLPNKGKGLFGPKRGAVLPAFASPDVRNQTLDEGQPNICQRASECNKVIGRIPACKVVGHQIVNSCQLRRRPLVLTFIFDRGADCYPQVDRVERVRPSLPGVNFVTVFFSKKKREQIRAIVRERGWRQPVAVDDRAITDLYRVGVCPTTVFSRAGGRVVTTRLGNLTEDQLRHLAHRIEG